MVTKQKRGFTLIELIAVLAILFILLVLIIAAVAGVIYLIAHSAAVVTSIVWLTFAY